MQRRYKNAAAERRREDVVAARTRRVAVLLNRNAQRVTPELVKKVGAAFPARDLFVTSTLDEARRSARAVVERGYDVVCVGGGDGTFIQAAGDLLAAAEQPPAMLALRLGSGNAIADVCGSGARTVRGVAGDIERARSGGVARVLRLLSVEGRPAHFAGAGIDAKLNEDFRGLVKEGIGRGRLGRVFHGTPGIVLSLVMRTVPRLIVEPRMHARVRNMGGPARRLDAGGRPAGHSIATGDTLYEGPVTIAAASTITQYARGLRFFPFADSLTDAFQVRVSSAGAREVLSHIPSIFAGTYRNADKVHDFAANAVRFELSPPGPVHVGGDLWGRREALSIELCARTVTLITSLRGA
jgi:diacylglycerol kinase family enzyme